MILRRIAKTLLYMFSLVFWLIGGTLFGLGLWMILDPQADDFLNIASSTGDLYEVALYIMTTIGGVVFVIGFLGCCGAARDSRIILTLYSAFVSIALLAEVTVIILVAIFGSEINNNIQTDLMRQVTEEYGNPEFDSVTQTWDDIQQAWECCGVEGFEDYDGSYFNNSNTDIPSVPGNPVEIKLSVPRSCCALDNNNDVQYYACLVEANVPKNTTNRFLYSKGCYQTMQDFAETNAIIILGIVLGFIVLEVIGLMFSCFVRSAIGKVL